MTDNTVARERIHLETPDIAAERLEQLRELFPEAFTEGRLDVDKLQESLGDVTKPDAERYSFTWAGKRNSIQILQTPSRATLTPDRDESVNFDTTQNLFIEGDNLEVLKLLYKSYFGRVKMIYIDPPYNTGNDFIYPDNYKDPLESYLQLTGQRDSEGNLLTSNPETSGRYHSAWLSMMYPRLFLARQLLRDDGVIFISIDDHEVHNLRMLMNEIFGEENFVANIVWEKKYTQSNDVDFFSDNHDHILCYAKFHESAEMHLLERTEEQAAAYKNYDNDIRGPWKPTPLHAKSGKNTAPFIFPNGVTWSPPMGTYRRFSDDSMRTLFCDNRIWFGSDNSAIPQRKTFLSEVKGGGLHLRLSGRTNKLATIMKPIQN